VRVHQIARRRPGKRAREPRRGVSVFAFFSGGRLQESLDFVVEHEHEGAAGTAEHVGEGALEEGTGALVLGDRRPAVHGVLVQHLGLCAAGLHHHAPAHGVEGVGDDARHSGHALEEKINI
jgi:hypothetical protein